MDKFEQQAAMRDEWVSSAPNCIHYYHGDCTKALPNTPCNLKGCVCYIKKGGVK